MAVYDFDHFIKTVTSAGTAETLKSSEFRVREAVIMAEGDNTGNIYIGGSAIDSTGHYLAAGEKFSLPMDEDNGGHDLSKIYIDADTNGEGVIVTYRKSKIV